MCMDGYEKYLLTTAHLARWISLLASALFCPARLRTRWWSDVAEDFCYTFANREGFS